MKIKIIPVMLLLMILSFATLAKAASSKEKSLIDTTLIPMTNQEWRTQVQQNQDDPIKLMQLAMTKAFVDQSQSPFALETIRTLLTDREFTVAGKTKSCLNLMAAYILIYDTEFLYASRGISKEQNATYEMVEYLTMQYGENN
jgi:hypothetical protein